MTAWDVLSVLGSLIGFVLLLVLAWWAARFVGRGYGYNGSGSRSLQVLDRLPMGGEKQLLVVKAAGRVLLLGVTAHRVEVLCELDESRLPPPPAAPGNSPFLAAFQRAMDQRKGRENRDEQDGPAQDG